MQIYRNYIQYSWYQDKSEKLISQSEDKQILQKYTMTEIFDFQGTEININTQTVTIKATVPI